MNICKESNIDTCDEPMLSYVGHGMLDKSRGLVDLGGSPLLLEVEAECMM